MEQCPADLVYALNLCPIYDAVFPLARIHWSRDERIKLGIALLSNATSIPLAKSLLPEPTALGSAGLEYLVPSREMLPPGDKTIIALDWKLRLPLSDFVIFIPLSHQAHKQVTVLAGMIDITCQGKIATTKCKYERLCLEHRRSLRIYFSCTMSGN